MIIKRFLHYFTFLTTFYFRLSTTNPLVGKQIEPTEKNEFPFLVALSGSSDITKREHYFCGRTLISQRHVLTSEHCIEGEGPNVRLIVNPANTKSATAYKLKSWIAYKEWAMERNIIPEEYDNDIAIITLTDDVKNVKPAVISKLKDEEVIGKKVVTVGWDSANETVQRIPIPLMKTYLKVLNVDEFRTNMIALFGTKSRYNPSLYYTSSDPPVITSCGDSGGPLMLGSNKQIVGINDSACNVDEPEKNPHLMSRHVNLDYYRDFIEDIIRN